ncbi:MAG: hypothetical protein EBZ49_00745 [Proteobacteria bacterium]|nr:hypothetical protein [Pseudomonadota bacterium]
MDEIYGDYQAQYTMNRAAYGDVPAAMMGGGGGYSGMMGGAGHMLGDIGSRIMPISYQAPSRYHQGYYGMVQQHQGMMRGLAGMVGLQSVPRGTSAQEFNYYSAADVGGRLSGGLAGAGTAAGGIAAGFALQGAGTAVGSAVGGAIGSLVGPVGTAIGAGIGGFVGGIASYAVGAAAAGVINSAAGARRDIDAFLESNSFRFVGAGSSMADPRFGRGMNRGARQQVGEMIRGMDIKDPQLNTQDLTQILQEGTQLGLMSGVQDMNDFQKKFKDITENVKSVTKMLHQTLSEGLKTIKDLKAIGVEGGDVKSMLGTADISGRISGRTAGEALGLGLQGAEMFRGTGVSMGIGAQATMMNLASVRASRDAGLLSQEAISQAGGEEALAMRQTAGGLAFSQSAMGRGFGAAFFNPAMGGNGFNSSAFMGNMMAGGGNLIGMAQQAAANIGSPAALISYQANQEKFVSEMGKAFGGRGLQMAAIGTAAATAGMLTSSIGGLKFEDAFRFSMKQQGKSDAEIDATIAEAKNADKNFATGQEAVANARAKAIQEDSAKNNIFNRASAKIGDVVKNAADELGGRAISNFISRAREAFVTFKEENIDGISRVSTARIDTSLRDAEPGTKGVRGGDLSKGNALGINKTAGTSVLEALSPRFGEQSALAKAFDVKTELLTREEAEKRGMTILSDHGSKVTAVDSEKLKQISESNYGMSVSDAAEMKKAGLLDKVSMKKDIGQILSSGSKISSLDDVSQAMFGKKATELSKAQYAKMVDEVKDTSLKSLVDEASEGANKVKAGVEAVDVANLKEAVGKYEDVRKTLANKAHAPIADGVIERVQRARELSKKGDKKSKDEAEKLLAEAHKMQANVEIDGKKMDASKVKSVIDTIKSSDKELDTAKDAINTVADIQESRGGRMLSRALTADIEGEAGKKLTFDQKVALKGVSKNLESGSLEEVLKIAHSEDGKLLKTVGASGAAFAKEIEKIEKLNSKDPAAARAELETYRKTAAGNTAVSGSSTGAEDPNKAATTQTNINVQTLEVMKALAKRLGV